MDDMIYHIPRCNNKKTEVVIFKEYDINDIEQEIRRRKLMWEGGGFHCWMERKSVIYTYCAVAKNRIVAVAMISNQYIWGANVGFWVQESYRNKGIGTKLIEHISNKCQELGIAFSTSITSWNNYVKKETRLKQLCRQERVRSSKISLVG